MKIDVITSLQELLDIAKETVKEVAAGEEYIVKDLFRGFEWNRITKGNRTKQGSMFLNYAQNEGQKSLDVLRKTP